MAGKLVSHMAFGALLGLFGAALQPNFRVRAFMQMGAGVLMILMGANMFGLLGQALVRVPEVTPDLVTDRVSGGGATGGHQHRHPQAGPALEGDVAATEQGQLARMNSPTKAEASSAARSPTTT